MSGRRHHRVGEYLHLKKKPIEALGARLRTVSTGTDRYDQKNTLTPREVEVMSR
jgi:hypothetical protein